VPGVAGREETAMAVEFSRISPDWSRGGAVRLAIWMSHRAGLQPAIRSLVN